MRIFGAVIATETNTFSAIPTSLDAYEVCVFPRPGEHPEDTTPMCATPLWVAKDGRAGWVHLIEGSCFAASPAGTTNCAVYEMMPD